MTTPPVGSASTGSTSPSGKGRPTPKRSDAQRRRGGPVLPPPANRKEAAKRAREQAALERAQAKDGTKRGDQRLMVGRDQGPVRALVRDVVDGRRNVGVLMLPLALLLVVAQLSGSEALISFALLLWVSTLLAVVADVVVTAVLIRRRVRAAFPEETTLKGHVGYGLLRSTVFRRFRMPPATVSPKGFRRR
ncbi:MAG: conserved rane protein of unknown function [Frankiales bacterium]|nr:conserved rane protein of unknown function [Frankiales bacterium]